MTTESPTKSSVWREIVSHTILAGAVAVGFFVIPEVQNTTLLEQPHVVIQHTVMVYSASAAMVSLTGCGLRRSGSSSAPAVVLQAGGCHVAGCLLFHVVLVLFGAPFFRKTADTFHAAFLLGSLAVLPPAYSLSRDANGWIRLFAQGQPRGPAEVACCLTSHGAVLGAWVGAIPIPLDWDRPWQVWPISVVYGTVGGYMLGCLAAITALLLMDTKLAKSKAA